MESVVKARITNVARFKVPSTECLHDFALIYPEFLKRLPSGNLKRQCLNRSRSFQKLNFTFEHDYRIYGINLSGELFFAYATDYQRVFDGLVQILKPSAKGDIESEFLFYFMDGANLKGCCSVSPSSCLSFVYNTAEYNNIVGFDLIDFLIQHQTT